MWRATHTTTIINEADLVAAENPFMQTRILNITASHQLLDSYGKLYRLVVDFHHHLPGLERFAPLNLPAWDDAFPIASNAEAVTAIFGEPHEVTSRAVTYMRKPPSRLVMTIPLRPTAVPKPRRPT